MKKIMALLTVFLALLFLAFDASAFDEKPDKVSKIEVVGHLSIGNQVAVGASTSASSPGDVIACNDKNVSVGLNSAFKSSTMSYRKLAA